MSLIYRLTALSLLCSATPAVGQVIPDKGTATTVSKAASGRVTVGIASANSSGISHNTYTEFSARKAGVGLDNRGSMPRPSSMK